MASQPHDPINPIDRPQVIANIDADVEDNLASLITAEDVRLRLKDLAVSFVNKVTDLSADLDFENVDPTLLADRQTIADYVAANSGGSGGNILDSLATSISADFDSYVAVQSASESPLLFRQVGGNDFVFDAAFATSSHNDLIWRGVANTDDGLPYLDFQTTVNLLPKAGYELLNYKFGNGNHVIQSVNGNSFISGGVMLNSNYANSGDSVTISGMDISLVKGIDLFVGTSNPGDRTLQLTECNARLGNLSADNITISGGYVRVENDLTFSQSLTLTNGAVLKVGGNIDGTDDNGVISLNSDNTLYCYGTTQLDNVVLNGFLNRVKFKILDSALGVTLSSGQGYNTVQVGSVYNVTNVGIYSGSNSNTITFDDKSDQVTLYMHSACQNNLLKMPVLYNAGGSSASIINGSNNHIEFSDTYNYNSYVNGRLTISGDSNFVRSYNVIDAEIVGASNTVFKAPTIAGSMDAANEKNIFDCQDFNITNINGNDLQIRSNNATGSVTIDTFNSIIDFGKVGNTAFALNLGGDSNKILCHFDNSSYGNFTISGNSNHLNVSSSTNDISNPFITGNRNIINTSSSMTGIDFGVLPTQGERNTIICTGGGGTANAGDRNIIIGADTAVSAGSDGAVRIHNAPSGTNKNL